LLAGDPTTNPSMAIITANIIVNLFLCLYVDKEG